MAETVILLTGTPRSGSTFLSLFLARCGCDPAILAPPMPNAWNDEWAECSGLHYHAGTLLGIDPDTGLPRAARPSLLDPKAVEDFQTYLRGRAASVKGTYLLKFNFAPFLMPEIVAALKGLTLKLVTTTRNLASVKASLAARSGALENRAEAYVTSLTSELGSRKTAWRGVSLTVDFDAVIANPKKALEPLVASLGLRATPEAWATFNIDKVRF